MYTFIFGLNVFLLFVVITQSTENVRFNGSDVQKNDTLLIVNSSERGAEILNDIDSAAGNKGEEKQYDTETTIRKGKSRVKAEVKKSKEKENPQAKERRHKS